MFDFIDTASGAGIDPPQLGISELNHVVWVFLFGLTLLAGIASWSAKIGTKKFTKFSVIELIGECALSVSVGLSVFLYMTSQEYTELLNVAVSTLFAHQATRLVYILGNLITAYGNKISPKSKTEIEILAEKYNMDEEAIIDFLESNKK